MRTHAETIQQQFDPQARSYLTSAVHARGPSGDRGVVDGAKAMAMTAVDLWVDAQLRAAVDAEFDRRPTSAEVV